MVSKRIMELSLKLNEKKALEELKLRLGKKLPGCDIVLFGSRARGEGDAYSDMDILIIVDSHVDGRLRDIINDISYPLEIEFDVVFGKVVENRNAWNSAVSRSMPFHWNIDREGIVL